MHSLTVPRVQERALKSLERLPSLSPVAGRLLSLLTFRKVEFDDIAQLVEKDALLCGHILRTVNSAGFGRARTITSIRHAITLLGLARLRRIAISFTVTNLFSKVKLPTFWSRTSFTLHSTATAILVEAIADTVPYAEGKEGAFVAGMMHDLGKLLIAVSFPQEYEMVAATASASGRPLVECEREMFGTDHAEISGLALTRWAVPETICRAVYHHHAAEPLAANVPWLSIVIQKADQFVNHLGISVLNTYSPTALPNPFEGLDMTTVLARFETEWKEASELLR